MDGMRLPAIVRLVTKSYMQGVGFRATVKDLAYKMNIKGTVRNLPDGTVEIYCNAPDEKAYEEFVGTLEKEFNIGFFEFREGTTGYGKGPEHWLGFNIIHDEINHTDETLEYIVKGANEMLKVLNEISKGMGNLNTGMNNLNTGMNNLNTGMNNLNTGMNNLNTGMSNLNKKMDALSNETKEINKGIVGLNAKQDIMIEKQDATLCAVNNMNKNMTQRFDWLGDRYGEFGKDIKSVKDDIHELKDVLIGQLPSKKKRNSKHAKKTTGSRNLKKKQ